MQVVLESAFRHSREKELHFNIINVVRSALRQIDMLLDQNKKEEMLRMSIDGEVGFTLSCR